MAVLFFTLLMSSFHQHYALKLPTLTTKTNYLTFQELPGYSVEYFTQASAHHPKLMHAINGEPKSGTTWFEFVLDGILKHGCKGNNCKYKKLLKDVGINHGPNGKHVIPGVGHYSGFDFSMPPNMSDAQINTAASKALKDSTYNYLTIFRDPRAVLVSSCKYQKQEDCDKFARLNMKASVGWIHLRHRFFRAVVDQNKARAHITFFEGLKSQFHEEVRGLATYLGIQLSSESITKIEKETSITSMKKAQKKGEIPQGHKYAHKVRQGDACGFHDSLAEDTVKEITAHMDATMNSQLRSQFC